MRLLLALLTVAAAVAVAPMAASGATFNSESSTDPDFCGTGASVDALLENTLAHLSERDGVGKAEHRGSVTFSYGDASVILTSRGNSRTRSSQRKRAAWRFTSSSRRESR